MELYRYPRTLTRKKRRAAEDKKRQRKLRWRYRVWKGGFVLSPPEYRQ